ncbi:MAG TPA: cell wall hydrolase [Pseudogracilibacillus sp.]|nr:cell wall hydrolase [Pseudogracilibacillus sp.]
MKKSIVTTLIGLGTIFMSTTVASAYTVKEGDTLSDIATEHNVSLNTLIAKNPHIGNPNLIFPKQNITIPNDDTKKVSKVADKVESKVASKAFSTSQSEIDLLERLVEAEAGIEPFEGKVAVAKVVLNRVQSEQFPNTITDVIYQPRQFTPVSNGMINRTASEDSKKAVQIALNEGGNANGAMYFYDPRYASGQSWFNTLTTAEVIGNHVFKY